MRHTVWRVEEDAAPWVEAFAEVPLAYVADGHHRAAAAFRAGQQRRAANPAHTGREEYNWFLAVLFPGTQLRILPYNRCVAIQRSRARLFAGLKILLPLRLTVLIRPSA